ncbi:MAG TPA: ROK family protein [Pseudolysinimonas sp.]|nr:ROK family protein [Pseudolysinimonas sp.]
MTQIDPGTPTWLRTHNDRTAYRLLLEHGPLTRARLGELSGMSKPTAAQMLARLERLELIGPVGEVSAGRGPNAMSYGVRTDHVTGVAISVLEHSIQAVVVDVADAEHPIVELDLREPGRIRTPEGDVSAAVTAACAAAGMETSSVSRVLIGVQAAVLEDDDELSFTDTLPGWPSRGARQRIEKALGYTVTLDNDVKLATMAERSVGAAGGTPGFALVWIGEGLGVGVDMGGVVHRGAFGGAGEIGYLEVPRSATALDPGAHDLTDLLGGPATARLLGGRSLAEVLPGLAADDAALDAIADRVVMAMQPVLAVIDPAMIVLGGPTALAGGEPLAERVAARVDRVARPRLAIRMSTTGSQPVLLGARQQLVQQIRDHLEAGIASAV